MSEPSSPPGRAVILGAGRTGRGLAAVMLQHEEPDEQEGGWHREHKPEDNRAQQGNNGQASIEYDLRSQRQTISTQRGH